MYSFFSGVIICSKQEFVLFCLKEREKKKVTCGMARATQELKLARAYWVTLVPILPKITPELLWPRMGLRHWVGSYKPYSEPGHTEVWHAQMMSVVCL